MTPIWLELYEEEILNLPNDTDLGKYVRIKFWKEKRKKEEKQFVEYDHCVICGKLSPYTIETNIDDRVGYVDGGGQGCFMPNECDKV
jgi:hypothetical protein